MADVRCQYCRAPAELSAAQSAALNRDYRATLLCRQCRQSFEFVLPRTVGMESTEEFYPFAATDPNMAVLSEEALLRRPVDLAVEAPTAAGGMPPWLMWGLPLLLFAIAAVALMLIL